MDYVQGEIPAARASDWNLQRQASAEDLIPAKDKGEVLTRVGAEATPIVEIQVENVQTTNQSNRSPKSLNCQAVTPQCGHAVLCAV